ncbi:MULTISPECIES: hypothetical protein [Bacillaceae]|uniref:Uncharacterized protein n=1 Tax=Oceanobacillus kimchii TaxID=746691 RepID=A0ABQ5TFV1_9BACI|nr:MULTISPECIES: hypothetical protein [Bacillaceae]GLO65012.1 hypothetical protein MACH08_07960 [Oceanobacillus kimchii]
MRAINKSDQKKLVIHGSYSEAHLIREALSLYRLRMETVNGKNSEEEKIVGELMYKIMNPEVEKAITEMKNQ